MQDAYDPESTGAHDVDRHICFMYLVSFCFFWVSASLSE